MRKVKEKCVVTLTEDLYPSSFILINVNRFLKTKKEERKSILWGKKKLDREFKVLKKCDDFIFQ